MTDTTPQPSTTPDAPQTCTCKPERASPTLVCMHCGLPVSEAPQTCECGHPKHEHSRTGCWHVDASMCPCVDFAAPTSITPEQPTPEWLQRMRDAGYRFDPAVKGERPFPLEQVAPTAAGALSDTELAEIRERVHYGSSLAHVPGSTLAQSQRDAQRLLAHIDTLQHQLNQIRGEE